MKGTLITVVLIGLAAAVAWVYYLNNDDFQDVELAAIKRTTSTLATTLQENQQQAARNRTPTNSPTPMSRQFFEPESQVTPAPRPTPNIEATAEAQVADIVRRVEAELQAQQEINLKIPTPTAPPTPRSAVPTGQTQVSVITNPVLDARRGTPSPSVAHAESATPTAESTRPPSTNTPLYTSTPQPTPQPIITASRVERTITTGMGKRVDAAVQGFADSPSIFNMLVQIIDEEEQLLGLAFPAPKVRVTKVNSLAGGFCGNSHSYRQYEQPGNKVPW